jgi:putative flippase GtrA/SAM-dependent methyltransferase
LSRILSPTIMEGIACYSTATASSYDDYPDVGFELTDSNAETSFWVRSRNRLFGWLVRRELARIGTARLLDVGCGTGDFMRELLGLPRLSLTGSEIYLAGLRFARQRLPDVEFIQYDVTEGSLDRSFDIVTAFDVLEHVERDLDGLRHIHSMLSDDGVLFLSVPQHPFLWSTLDKLVHHKRRYTRRLMLDRLHEAGFQPIRVTSHVFVSFPLMLLSRLLDQFRHRRAGEGKAAKSVDPRQEIEDRVVFSAPLNWAFEGLMRLDEALIRLGLSLPFGGTLVVVARRRDCRPETGRLVVSDLGKQMPRFLAVGGVNFLFTFAIYFCSLNLLHLPYPVALGLASLLGNILTYVLNFVWVFRPEPQLTFRGRFLKYLGTGAVSIILNLLALSALVELCGMDPFWAQVVLIPFIVFGNFAAAKWWSLRQADPQP